MKTTVIAVATHLHITDRSSTRKIIDKISRPKEMENGAGDRDLRETDQA
ncbi:hypothetical protein [Sinorhizobium meliloti]|nr:hypothetical protein [Sinorhizobium meliloti]